MLQLLKYVSFPKSWIFSLNDNKEFSVCVDSSGQRLLL